MARPTGCTPDHPPTRPRSARCASWPRPARARQLDPARPHHHRQLGRRHRDRAGRAAGLPTKTVYKWLHRFNADGVDGLGDLPRPGIPRRLTETERGRIIALARSPPPGRLVQGGEGLLAPADPEAPAHWTLDALTEAAQAEGSRSARSQVRRILLAEGMRWRRTRSWATSTDPEFAPKERRSSPSTPPARGHDGDLRRRAGPGDPARLPTRARLDPGRPPRQGAAGLRPRAGEDLGVRRPAARSTAQRSR